MSRKQLRYKKMLQHKNLKINFLICSLITLLPNSEAFILLNNKQNFQKNFDEASYETIYLTLDSKILSSLQKILNKPTLRAFVYTLLEPIFGENNYYNRFCRTDPQILEKKNLLKQYLKKFRHNYIRHFSSPTINPNTIITNKEINKVAIKALIFIHGFKYE